MANNFYPQSERRSETKTVGELIRLLQMYDPALPVVFQTPRYGVFGAEMMYSVEGIYKIQYEREEVAHPASVRFDEEDGEEYPVEPWTEVLLPWEGVVVG